MTSYVLYLSIKVIYITEGQATVRYIDTGKIDIVKYYARLVFVRMINNIYSQDDVI